MTKNYVALVYLYDENGNPIRPVFMKYNGISAQNAVESIRADFLRDTDKIVQVFEETDQEWDQAYNNSFKEVIDDIVQTCPGVYFKMLHHFVPDGTTRYIPESIMSPKVRFYNQKVEDVYPEYFKSHPLPKLD